MKVKGYYNLNNGIFLGPVTAKNELTGAAITPRYVDGVCFGEYDTETDVFVPQTNPYKINGVMEINEDVNAFVNGGHKEQITGVEEDKGSDVASKGSFAVGTAFKPGYTPGVETRDSQGNKYKDLPISKSNKIKTDVTKKVENSTKEITVCEKPRNLKKSDLKKIDFGKLFK